MIARLGVSAGQAERRCVGFIRSAERHVPPASLEVSAISALSNHDNDRESAPASVMRPPETKQATSTGPVAKQATVGHVVAVMRSTVAVAGVGTIAAAPPRAEMASAFEPFIVGLCPPGHDVAARAAAGEGEIRPASAMPSKGRVGTGNNDRRAQDGRPCEPCVAAIFHGWFLSVGRKVWS